MNSTVETCHSERPNPVINSTLATGARNLYPFLRRRSVEIPRAVNG